MTDTASNAGRYAPETEDDDAPIMNAVHCLDCGLTHVGDIEPRATCPASDEHAAEPVHLTRTPLGYQDDGDHLVRHTDVYHYPAREPKRSEPFEPFQA